MNRKERRKWLADVYEKNPKTLENQIAHDKRMLEIDKQRLSEARQCLYDSQKALEIIKRRQEDARNK